MPPVTLNLIIANVAVFLLETAGMVSPGGAFALWPPASGPLGSNFEPWQLVTYSFLHGNMAHIFFNMFALYMFGSDVERLFGSVFRRVLFRERARGSDLPPRRYHLDGRGARAYRRRLGRHLRRAPRLRDLLPPSPGDAPHPAHTYERAHPRGGVRGAGARLWRHRHGVRRRALRAPRRDAGGVSHDSLPPRLQALI